MVGRSRRVRWLLVQHRGRRGIRSAGGSSRAGFSTSIGILGVGGDKESFADHIQEVVRLRADVMLIERASMGLRDLVQLSPLLSRTAGQNDVVVGLIDGPVFRAHPDLAESPVHELKNGEWRSRLVYASRESGVPAWHACRWYSVGPPNICRTRDLCCVHVTSSSHLYEDPFHCSRSPHYPTRGACRGTP